MNSAAIILAVAGPELALDLVLECLKLRVGEMTSLLTVMFPSPDTWTPHVNKCFGFFQYIFIDHKSIGVFWVGAIAIAPPLFMVWYGILWFLVNVFIDQNPES